MVGRIVVATLVLGATLLVGISGTDDFRGFTQRLLSLLIAAMFGASVLFALWVTRGKHLHAQALVQIGLDLLLTTGLVYATGGAASAFTFLYGVTILMTALILGPSACLAAAAAACFLYVSLSVSLFETWVPYPPDQTVPSDYRDLVRVAFYGFRTLLGLSVLAILSSKLSARLLATGGALKRVTKSVQELAQLNDDIVRSMSSGLITTDLDGRIQSVNHAGMAILDTTAPNVIGRSLSSVLPPAANVPLHATQRVQGKGIREGHGTFPVGLTAGPLSDSEGRDTGQLVLFQDLTEIEELRVAKQRADRLASLGRLAAGLAHEIRNPLSSISGSVQLVSESNGLENEDQRLLQLVLREVERINGLVSDMLQVGRPATPRRRHVDINGLVRDTVEIAKKGIGSSSHVDVSLQIPSGETIAEVDPDQIRQVIWNLIKNAIQATKSDGSVDVMVSEDTHSFVIEVRDSGHGIPEEQKNRLFDTFFSSKHQGVGLGLAVVKQIVDAHSGSIEIKSVVQEGATFLVRIPLRSDTETV